MMLHRANERKNNYLIRLALPEDYGLIHDLAQRAYAPYVPRMDSKPFPMLDDYAAHIAAGRAYVLEDSNGLQGYVILMQEPESLLLDNIAVHPACQGYGYGRALMDFAENFAREKGLGQICLYTNVAMRENLALYPHFGYQETGRALQNGYQRVFFRKKIMPG